MEIKNNKNNWELLIYYRFLIYRVFIKIYIKNTELFLILIILTIANIVLNVDSIKKTLFYEILMFLLLPLIFRVRNIKLEVTIEFYISVIIIHIIIEICIFLYKKYVSVEKTNGIELKKKYKELKFIYLALICFTLLTLFFKVILK